MALGVLEQWIYSRNGTLYYLVTAGDPLNNPPGRWIAFWIHQIIAGAHSNYYYCAARYVSE